jgi:hypothetical protein
MKIKLRFENHETGTIIRIMADKYNNAGELLSSKSVGYVSSRLIAKGVKFKDIDFD